MFKLLQTFLFSGALVLSLQAQDISDGQVLSRDLITNDAAKAANFYTSLFGWTATNKDELSTLENDIEEINIIIQLEKDKQVMGHVIEVRSKNQAQWVPIFSHDNLTKAKTNILENSGEIIKDVKQEHGIGDFLLIKDTQGALSLLTNSSSHNTNSNFPQVNEWLWDELWSHNIKKSKAFYAQLYNYKLDTLPSGYIAFKSNDTWRAGLLTNPFEKSKTQWVSTIRVNDPEAISQAALKLGGKILVSVHEHKEHREAALLSDPTGAVFIVEKYEEKEQK